MHSNFSHLADLSRELAKLGQKAEHYFSDDPNTTLLKLRQFGELLAQEVAARFGVYQADQAETQLDLIRKLDQSGALSPEIKQLFHSLRKAGNAASHSLLDDYKTALENLKVARQLGVWFYRTFGDPHYAAGPFVPPQAPKAKAESLKQEIAALQEALQKHRANLAAAEAQAGTAQQLAEQAQEEARLWETLATEAELSKEQLKATLNALQAQAQTTPKEKANELVIQAQKAGQKVELDEAATRTLTDGQLRAAGWEADSVNLRFANGTRPEPGRFLAIAEWPTASGPADYALFVGLDFVGVVEAKRANKHVAGAIDQAKRYARDVEPHEARLVGGPWQEHKAPFVFSTNGRPYLNQLKEFSGTWFCDLRRPENLRKPLDGWYSPQGLKELLKQDIAAAETKLDKLGFDFDFPLRDYQREAILAVEQAIKSGRRDCLVAMATGTGKTKTCIALVYRLLKAQRFRRVLFLVDRSALGEQAANAFKETRMESLQAFADIFGIKELTDQTPEADTKVHLATVQGLVKRILYSDDSERGLNVDDYDCIVVDECHRGYLLDKELSETEQTFRDQTDYISKYRRILDYFDAVRIGLTATPALHTTEIFGPPVYTYSYREAVLDGVLVDHLPPIVIRTQLAEAGIRFKAGEEAAVYRPDLGKVETYKLPDEQNFDVADFNRKVLTESFNQAVCEELRDHLTPFGPEKTLVFCVNDLHADLVTRLLKEAFQKKYGEDITDDMVLKITGASDKPLQLIRRYRNEIWPTIAVTVDLLTTGIDVPSISSLVFLRKVNSRILFEQMLGRATRRADDIGKDVFRIFDAVGTYADMQAVSSMRPVVVNPKVSFTQLAGELAGDLSDEAKTLARDQFVAKFQRQMRHLSDPAKALFEAQTGQSPKAFAKQLKTMTLPNVAEWFTANPWLAELLDTRSGRPVDPIFISDHEDKIIEVGHHFGRPEDYLDNFSRFIREQANTLPALITVLQKPCELTRKELKALAVALDAAGFTEKNLDAAWEARSNHEIAAGILGYIRQAALGDALIPFAERVDKAVAALEARHNFSPVQKQWLARLAKQLKTNAVLDRETLDSGPLKRDGGFKTANKIFDGQLEELLAEMNEAVWLSQAG
ncbi:type I restriction-modification system endonuclease [Methylocaldum sp. 14B]|uniref:type I restriction-modification system endonuclease n=1 Tax=Methylocaldum sp. 14B TaxID=1912213 RepID=UPI00098AD39A|nr:type I restriction-modification system endonuclease [Methylocaldum sp. 14B]